MPCEWRKAKRLLRSEVGDTTRDQIVFPAYAALDVDCGKLSCAPNLITNLTKGNNLGIVVKNLEDGSKKNITHALRLFHGC